MVPIRFDFEYLCSIEDSELVKSKRLLFDLYGFTETFNVASDSIATSLIFPASRIYHLTDRDLYFIEKKLKFSCRDQNERLAALNFVNPNNECRSLIFLWKRLNELKPDQETVKIKEYILHKMDVLYSNSIKTNTCSGKSILEDKTVNFEQWFANEWSKSAINSDLRVAMFGELRGLSSTLPINSEQTFLHLPRSKIISYHCLKDTPLHYLLEDPQLSKEVLLLIFAIWSFHQESSPWRHYWNVIPTEVDTALSFTPHELELFSSTTIKQEIEQLQENNRNAYETIFSRLRNEHPNDFPEQEFNMNNFAWMQSIIDSRGIKLNLKFGDQIEPTLCLLPLVDVLNYSPISFLEGSTTIGDSEDSGYSLRSLVNLSEFEQIFMNYGPFSNRELLLYYGFVLENNPYDTFSFDISFEGYENEELQTKIAEKCELHVDQHLSMEHPIPTDVYMVIMLIIASQQELLQLDAIEDAHEAQKKLYEMCIANKDDIQATLLSLLQQLDETIETIDETGDMNGSSQKIYNINCYLKYQKQIIQHHSSKL